MKHLKSVLGVLLDNFFHIKLSKCVFGQEEIEYPDYVISHGRVKVDSKKIEAIQAWLNSKSII